MFLVPQTTLVISGLKATTWGSAPKEEFKRTASPSAVLNPYSSADLQAATCKAEMTRIVASAKKSRCPPGFCHRCKTTTSDLFKLFFSADAQTVTFKVHVNGVVRTIGGQMLFLAAYL